MKKIYFIFFLTTIFSYSQNELVGEWYLDHIIKEGVTHNNYYNESQVFSIEFTNIESFENYLEFSTAHVCNASNGIYSLNSNEITISIVGTISIDCYATPYAQYEALFMNELTFDDGDTIINHTYTITGVGNDQVLTFINTASGNTLVFKKHAPTILLVSTWWLHQIDIPGNPIINIPTTDTPYITFTNIIDPFNPFINIPEANGVGECEGFYTNYSVTFNGANNMSFSSFTQTLSGCATQAYEGIYFQILGDETTNFFQFEIIDNGSTLILTDLLGARLIFGDSTLSIEEEYIHELGITLKQNPVDNQLKLELDNSILTEKIKYYIYSIEGKIITSSKLYQDSIDVRNLISGIYFIRFNNSKTIKFIKK